ncbi:hypothetical protein Pla22_49110 [Rubripirellula amarantea]|uniref:Uncharacterized protein n=1 Tax=Rubripirellula amarantea TaxID=2527999 RepID=A0A5C5WI26_9BACT|nr:hypothetical protein [Rubripirellula amarantea]TWT49711.1 hypothetical protein Pla22_49110 [Rubripirellula amarantea]
MSNVTPLPPVDRLPVVAMRLFGRAAVRVVMVSAVGLAVLVATYPLLNWQLSQLAVVIISLLSVATSIAALIPGYSIANSIANRVIPDSVAAAFSQDKDEKDEAAKAKYVGHVRQALGKLSQVAMVGGTAAMAIRSLGTVALFAVCRYQFAEVVNQVAFLVIGWYVLLTVTEVVSLSRGAAVLDTFAVNSHDRRTLANTDLPVTSTGCFGPASRVSSPSNFFVEWLR